MRWVLSCLGGVAMTPSHGGSGAVEVVGFLEVPWDDAGCVVLCGVNEGSLPSSVSADAWLPDSLREALGLACNRSRLARDAYLLSLILNTRPGTVMIAGRRDGQGDPLLPSRLWLRDEPAVVAQRLARFYAEDDEVATVTASADSAGPSRLLIPEPAESERLATLRDRLRVTAFADYLRCPYRFYLQHVRGLRGVDDRGLDLSPLAFGTLLHGVFQVFAQQGPTGSGDAAVIERYVVEVLHERARLVAGRSPTPAVRLQIKLAEQRLEWFAREQASLVREGWRVLPGLVERDLEAEFAVDGGPFVLTGRIDRVDEHGEGGYRLIDYKTGDAGEKPNAKHYSKARGWIDLQLPLYTVLAESAGLAGPFTAGYFNLPKKPGDAGFQPMDWSKAPCEEALDVARDVITKLRAGVFWPPTAMSEEDAAHDPYAGVVYAGVHDWDVLCTMSEPGRRKREQTGGPS